MRLSSLSERYLVRSKRFSSNTTLIWRTRGCTSGNWRYIPALWTLLGLWPDLSADSRWCIMMGHGAAYACNSSQTDCDDSRCAIELREALWNNQTRQQGKPLPVIITQEILISMMHGLRTPEFHVAFKTSTASLHFDPSKWNIGQDRLLIISANPSSSLFPLPSPICPVLLLIFTRFQTISPST